MNYLETAADDKEVYIGALKFVPDTSTQSVNVDSLRTGYGGKRILAHSKTEPGPVKLACSNA